MAHYWESEADSEQSHAKQRGSAALSVGQAMDQSARKLVLARAPEHEGSPLPGMPSQAKGALGPAKSLVLVFSAASSISTFGTD